MWRGETNCNQPHTTVVLTWSPLVLPNPSTVTQLKASPSMSSSRCLEESMQRSRLHHEDPPTAEQTHDQFLRRSPNRHQLRRQLTNKRSACCADDFAEKPKREETAHELQCRGWHLWEVRLPPTCNSDATNLQSRPAGKAHPHMQAGKL